MADCFNLGKEIIRWDKTDVALAEFPTGDDFSLQLVMIPEEKVLADRNFSAGTDQALPVIRIGLELAREEDFDASAKEVAGRRIVWTENLRLKTCAAAIQTCGKYSSVVKDDQIARTKEAREVAESTILKSARCSGNVKKPRCRAVGERLLGD